MKKRMINKQKIDPQQWSELVKQNIGLRWKQRKEKYEHEESESKTSEIPQEVEMVNVEATQILEQSKESSKAIDDIEKGYNEIASDTSKGTLLLPSVHVSDEKQPFSYVASVLTTLEQQSLIEKARNERNRAMIDAKCYRDLAEKIMKEKRELENTMKRRTEVVRDFWRNKILEGDSRSGKILMASLAKNKQI